MNYKKFIRNAVKSRQETSLAAFALLAGLAAGAAIAVLFAPRSGRESRKLLTEKLNFTQQYEGNELEEHLIEDIRKTARNHAEHLQGPTNKRKDPTQIKVPSAGTTAWKKAIVE
ncbi:YtxH domain-containing protein [Pedobacter heparinus]|uniref:YtxH domain-containing protein n=1 Tax=Pedobacter heparinus (strain ATCC 13125 / DSM 2366 / CIP 104194 / JCM 7457 / NBRC 12017 / NCIMB 9290 / NRRL B-14731 / HIM 762-3) TaxID=485917 RepID=C6Y0C2_PEDHD|nr:YtxH domain-containing protein [Pedobacter heparinus]ACU04834.1 hypothetical protein Phep_2631 [Pedobacter heparinus DSM 2366]